MTIGTPDGDRHYHGQKWELDKFIALYEEEIIKDSYGKPIRVKTLGQRSMSIVSRIMMSPFGIGPAGTGKPS